MKRPVALVSVLVGVCSCLSVVAPTSAQAGQRVPTGLSWLALGDSFSSGEGLRNNDIAANPPARTSAAGQPVTAQNCERATGTSTTAPASRSWSVVARAALADARNGTPVEFAGFAVKACTGAVTNDWRKQWEEAGATPSDLVTFSMGGNNIGFAATVMACAGISVQGGFDAVLSGLPQRWPGRRSCRRAAAARRFSCGTAVAAMPWPRLACAAMRGRSICSRH